MIFCAVKNVLGISRSRALSAFSKAVSEPNIKDDFFLVAMGSLILLMQAGFAFLEAGSIRAKNATNILIKNFTDLCAGKFSPPFLTTSL